MTAAINDDDVLDSVGPRLRATRQKRGATLVQLSAATGISVSTLSRLESGQRRPTLELLLPLARAHQVPLDELVGAPPTGDPRRARQAGAARRPHDDPADPPARRAAGLQDAAPAGDRQTDQQSHEGYEWMYVLAGRLRLRLGELDLVLQAGEAAEFDTHTPHWFGCAGPRPSSCWCFSAHRANECMYAPARPPGARRDHADDRRARAGCAGHLSGRDRRRRRDIRIDRTHLGRIRRQAPTRPPVRGRR